MLITIIIYTYIWRYLSRGRRTLNDDSIDGGNTKRRWYQLKDTKYSPHDNFQESPAVPMYPSDTFLTKDNEAEVAIALNIEHRPSQLSLESNSIYQHINSGKQDMKFSGSTHTTGYIGESNHPQTINQFHSHGTEPLVVSDRREQQTKRFEREVRHMVGILHVLLATPFHSFLQLELTNTTS
jgi:hypothetical protein